MKKQHTKVRRSDAYIVKAAEGHPKHIISKEGGASARPSGGDKRLADALLKRRKAS